MTNHIMIENLIFPTFYFVDHNYQKYAQFATGLQNQQQSPRWMIFQGPSRRSRTGDWVCKATSDAFTRRGCFWSTRSHESNHFRFWRLLFLNNSVTFRNLQTFHRNSRTCSSSKRCFRRCMCNPFSQGEMA